MPVTPSGPMSETTTTGSRIWPLSQNTSSKERTARQTSQSLRSLRVLSLQWKSREVGPISAIRPRYHLPKKSPRQTSPTSGLERSSLRHDSVASTGPTSDQPRRMPTCPTCRISVSTGSRHSRPSSCVSAVSSGPPWLDRVDPRAVSSGPLSWFDRVSAVSSGPSSWLDRADPRSPSGRGVWRGVAQTLEARGPLRSHPSAFQSPSGRSSYSTESPLSSGAASRP